MGYKEYTEEQITAYVEHARDVGFSRAMRDLGYPGSYATCYKWADQRGVEVTRDAVRRAAAVTRHLMSDMEEIEVAQAGIERVHEELMENPNLTPDDHHKLANALRKHVETKQLLLGKVTSRTEQIHKDSVQAEIDSLMSQFESQVQDVQDNAESQ
jgi:hypothetical protein